MIDRSTADFHETDRVDETYFSMFCWRKVCKFLIAFEISGRMVCKFIITFKISEIVILSKKVRVTVL